MPRGVELGLDTKQMDRRLDMIEKKSKPLFNRAIKRWLTASAGAIHGHSVRIAKRETSISTQYIGAFQIEPIKRDAQRNLFIRVINLAMHSMVVEYGGFWKKMPPPEVLNKWVNMMFGSQLRMFVSKEGRLVEQRVGLVRESHVRAVAYAVGKKFLKRSGGTGRGQRFMKSKVPQQGRLRTMNRAFEKSQRYIGDRLRFDIEEALTKL